MRRDWSISVFGQAHSLALAPPFFGLAGHRIVDYHSTSHDPPCDLGSAFAVWRFTAASYEGDVHKGTHRRPGRICCRHKRAV